jgi:hypothetical protein
VPFYLSQLCSDYIAHHSPEIVRAAARITLVVSTVVDAEILLEVCFGWPIFFPEHVERVIKWCKTQDSPELRNERL